ncbi:MAG TPA: hypothetical protein PKN56_26000 [Leptospiraceae bacterium]|nr:hypothetical protein [Leptospiraceae bacterium]HNI98415.1 hypothetical protein [Leptospiraceae bacterium]HNN07034.1 hypothetical protein [Leptospiraceae bacterium]
MKLGLENFIIKNIIIIVLIFSAVHCKNPGNSGKDSESLLQNLGLTFVRSSRVTIEGTAVKGIVKQGTVTVNPVKTDGTCNTSAVLAGGTTDDSGNYSIAFSRTGGLVCITVSASGTGSTKMYDEKSNTDITLTSSSTFKLSKVLSETKITGSKRQGLLVSPFSKFAAARFQNLAKTADSKTDMNALYKKASKEVVIRFGLSTGLSSSSQKSEVNAQKDIRAAINDADYPELDDILTDLQNPASAVSAKFISITAGFSHLANKHKKGSTVTAEDVDSVISAFAADFEDGLFDGKKTDGTSITIGTGAVQTTFSGTPLTTVLLPAVTAYLQEGGKLSAGSPNTVSVTLTATEAASQIQFVDTTPINSDSTAGTVTPATISFSPSSGPAGTLLKITSLGPDLSNLSSVTISGVPAIILSKSSTSATAFVMPGATTGAVAATDGTTVMNASANFTVVSSGVIATQQGSKLVGTGNTGNATQGYSVALSADGNTAIIGGYSDNASQGAAWIFTRSGTTWTQQGSKLVGTGNTGAANQGKSAAISADGNTVVIGGPADNSNLGATWVFTRSGTTWTQQGSKLVGTGNVGNSQQGISVAISADGTTALTGGYMDNSVQGAIWVFTRSGTTWTQQGSKLVGTGGVGNTAQGFAVGISGDGNTAISGGYGDNTNVGAAWVFTRSGTTWSQQGSKLVGTGNVGAAQMACTIGLSADGNSAFLGGYGDNGGLGAAWVFKRSGSTWAQQGSKLVGSGNVGNSQQGYVSISADGNTAISGGQLDGTNMGASWIFVP